MKWKKYLKDEEHSDNTATDEKADKKTCIFLFLILLLALIFRSVALDKIFSDGKVIFQGYDEYYHARLIAYSVQNFPEFLWFDSYVDYPNGINIGWMPLYDLANAFIVLLIGFGSPSLYTTEAVVAIFPVLLGALTGAVNALDASTGEQRWKYETGYFVDAYPVLAGNTIYAASDDGKVHALNASTRERIWKSEQLYPVYAPPSVEGDSVFTGTLNGSMFRLNRADGRVEGLCAVSGTIRVSPIMRGELVYVGTKEGGLYECG